MMTAAPTLSGQTLFISGASRGIGLAIALRAARDGANIAVLGKTETPHPALPGTVHSAAAAIEQAGGQALGVICDIRDENQVAEAVAKTVERFGGIDILVNNASAIFLAKTEDTPMKRFDLMHQVNARGTFVCTQACMTHLKKSAHGRILTMSPPLDLRPAYFGPHVGYSLAKFGMSLCTLGFAEELRPFGVSANCLWPQTLIDTSAVRNLLGGPDMAARGRNPNIVADAAHFILTQAAHSTGQFYIDEDVLRAQGVTDFSAYNNCAPEDLVPDLFVPASLKPHD